MLVVIKRRDNWSSFANMHGISDDPVWTAAQQERVCYGK